jgi:hypothetical protein
MLPRVRRQHRHSQPTNT